MRDPEAEWLADIVLAIHKLPPENDMLVRGDTLVSMSIHQGTTGDFEIFGIDNGGEPAPLVNTEVFKLYPARLPSGQLGFMKTNTTPKTFALLELEAERLQTLQERAESLDEWAKERGETPYLYGSFIPQIVEEFVPLPDKLILFLGFPSSIRIYKQLIPLSVLTKDVHIDLQTAVWMLGKGLKALGFVHQSGYSLGRIDESNILIEPDQHGVFLLDFSEGFKYNTFQQHRSEINTLITCVIQAAGGSSPEDIPFQKEILSRENHEQFVHFLRHSLDYPLLDAHDIQKELYTLAESIWPKEVKPSGQLGRPFHPFVTYPR